MFPHDREETHPPGGGHEPRLRPPGAKRSWPVPVGVSGAGAAAVGIVSAPVSLPVVAVAAGVGLAVTAVSALWDSIFD